MPRFRLLLVGMMLTGVLQPLLAQEKVFKEYAESHNERSYCLYPSTLRMINIKKNEAFEEFASSFEKLLIYDLDSTSVAEKSYKTMTKRFVESGYEEYMSIFGDGNDVLILGKEMRTNEIVGVIGQEEGAYAFFLKGNVAWHKIPEIFETLSEGDVLNILDMKIDNR